MKKVAVTGVGAVTAYGYGQDALWHGLRTGKTSIHPVSYDECGIQWAGSIPGCRQEQMTERTSHMALYAASEAWRQSGLSADGVSCYEPQRIMINVSCSKWPALFLIDNIKKYGKLCPDSDFYSAGSPSYKIKQHLGLSDQIVCLSTAGACVTGLQSLIHAAWLIQAGHIDAALVGASEACLSSFFINGYRQMGVLSTGCSDGPHLFRPFDARADGFIPGEGAGVFVLESLECARKRGASILALLSYGDMVADAYHSTHFNPSDNTIADVVHKAFASRPYSGRGFGYINSHGTGTRKNDILELKALAAVLSQKSDGLDVVVQATKPLTGHTLGASGAVEAVLCVKVIQTQVIPHTAVAEQPRDNWNKQWSAAYISSGVFDFALKLSYGFGGHIAVVLFERMIL